MVMAKLPMNSKVRLALEAIDEAERNGPAVQHDFLTGFSGGKIIGLLQRLTSLCAEDEAYCEIGVYQGLSLISVAAANPKRMCIGIDNYAFFDPDGQNKSIVKQRIKSADCRNVTLIESDYEDARNDLQESLAGRTIGVLFVDGPHDYRSQLMSLLIFVPFLSEQAVLVVDDSNYAHVRLANRDFLTARPEFALIAEKYTHKHPNNMASDEFEAARNGWWNGLNVLLRDSSFDVPRTMPLTERCRSLFENDHLIHSMRYADAAPEALRFACALKPLKLRTAIRRFTELRGKLARSSSASLSFEDLNMRGL